MKSTDFWGNSVISLLNEKFPPPQVKRIAIGGVKFLRKYNEDIATASVLRSTSNKAYEALHPKHLVSHSSRCTLGRWLQDFKCTPGIQEGCLKVMREGLLLSEISHEKLMSISFDEMDSYEKGGISGNVKEGL